MVAKNSIRCLTKAYKSIIKTWFRRKKTSSSSITNDNPPHQDNRIQQEHVVDNNEMLLKNMNGIHNSGLDNDFLSDDDEMTSSILGCCICRHRSLDNSRLPSNSMASTSRNNTISRNKKKINHHTRSRSVESFDNYMATPSSLNSSGSLRMPHRMQSRNYSSRRNGTPIMYSNSSGMLKPPPIEKNLECTLEELCYGCKKTVMITRDVLTDTGGVVQEEELLTINVQPGWTKGTKITFVGKGNERPGAYTEDLIFYISEKKHQLFRREGDDLELCLEISLLQALTGCTISVPLLGGEHMNLTVDDIIHPGYQNIVNDQGMSISREPGKRGNLRITFLVKFPTDLTDNQRSEVFDILQNSC